MGQIMSNLLIRKRELTEDPAKFPALSFDRRRAASAAFGRYTSATSVTRLEVSPYQSTRPGNLT